MKELIITLFAISVLAILFSCSTEEQRFVTGSNLNEELHLETIVNYKVNYLLYLPEDYARSSKKWPLVLFLHGSGERGSDVELVKRNGPSKLVEEGKKFPFILVSPQCPERTIWDNKMLAALLDDIESKYNVDKNREYLTGLSMGGHATWSLAIQYPERFAAILPVCARGYPQDVYVLKDVPVWVFHGKKDDIVPITDGEKMVRALIEAGGNVKFTIYPEAGHDAWTETYNNPEIYEWLLSHSLEDKE
jgi:predicted peptidase